MSLVDTVTVPVAFRRAEWIGYGVLWPRAMLHNASGWGPQMNREYQAAYDAQKCGIEDAIAQETPEMKRRRTECCGACAPNPCDDVFDAYLGIAEMQNSISFQKGAIMALEMNRHCNETHLAEAKKEFFVLQRQKEILLEKFWNKYPQHLERNGVRIFIKEDGDISAGDGGGGDGGDGGGVDCVDGDGDGGDGVLGKRKMRTAHSHGHTDDDTMLGHNSKYWLGNNRLNVGIAILSSE